MKYLDITQYTRLSTVACIASLKLLGILLKYTCGY